MAKQKPVLAFRNFTQKVLFIAELRGQLSDGRWENSKPDMHFEVWHECDVIVDPANVGRDFYASRDKYAFSHGDLLDVVDMRMRYYMALAQTQPDAVEKLLVAKVRLPENYTQFFVAEHDFQRARIAQWKEAGLKLLTRGYRDFQNASYRDLVRELKGMQEIVRVTRKESAV